MSTPPPPRDNDSQQLNIAAPPNRLYYGDNLAVLRTYLADESVDLIYLDPPFNSNAGYNVLFKQASGAGAEASIEAFDDTWTWGDASRLAYLDIAGSTNIRLKKLLDAFRDSIGENPMLAYLTMMAVRLVELRRVLKPTGSLYLHCDPTASHYLKLVLDAVFGPENYINEITWKRTYAHNDSKQGARHFGRVSDRVLFYSKTADRKWKPLYRDYNAKYLERDYRRVDENGRRYRLDNIQGPGGADKGNPYYEVMGVSRHWRYSKAKMQALIAQGLIIQTRPGAVPQYKRYLDEMPGVPIADVWDDVPLLNNRDKERLGYPTQKPRALLERIIAASSNPGDLVLDPFCGCGTAVDAAQKLGRRWIGIDVTHIAIGMIEDRMREGYPGIRFETIGVPRDLASAERLAADDPHQFQQWVCWQVGGFPRDKKGGDKGVDGWFNFLGQARRIETGVISVKAGDNVNPTMVRDLGRVMERDGHRFGLFVMKALPTKGMRDEAASQPMVETEWGRFPALQFVTLAELFQGIKPKLPPLISPVKKASRVETRASHQQGAQGLLV